MASNGQAAHLSQPLGRLPARSCVSRITLNPPICQHWVWRMDHSQAAAFEAKSFIQTLTHRPGVYCMLDAQGEYLYVGKAKDLKKRVSSYFNRGAQSPRIQAMVGNIARIQINITHTEAEALLLENTLIKQHRPRYNVLLRDDKSYPYLYVSIDHAFPRLGLHRGARKAAGRYFGPYLSAVAVRQTLNHLQKLFKLRTCRDSFFSNRSRPCLQYQIKRCTAPCVELIDAAEYRQNVEQASQFLQGRSDAVTQALVKRMEAAAEQLDFEQAAEYRNRIEMLRSISARQHVTTEGGDADILAVASEPGLVCVAVASVRAGRHLGTRAYFPRVPLTLEDAARQRPASLITAFIGQYYLDRPIPPRIIVGVEPEDRTVLTEMLAHKRGAKVVLVQRAQSEGARWLEMATHDARQALAARLASRETTAKRLANLQALLYLPSPPTRMECFDVSHTQGEATMAACVVFGAEGPLKSDYRRFAIQGIERGDDYAALKQALSRRYRRLKQGEASMPDILFIDGGKGQVSQARQVLAALQVTTVRLIGVAKGEGRRPGLEKLILSGQDEPVILPPESPALHLIQQIRDEAHRFAITGHRQRRARSRNRSVLEDIPGLGPKRRQSLLKHFGGMRGVSRAGVEELMKTPGISRRLAQTIYDTLHAQAPHT